MTRRFSVLFLSLAATVVLAMPAVAQDVKITLLGVTSGAPDYGPAGPNSETGVTGIYTGTVENLTTHTVTQANFVCDDFLSTVGLGDHWDAYANSNNPVSTGTTGVKFQVPYAGDSGWWAGVTNPDLKTYGLTTQQVYNMIAYEMEQIFDSNTPMSSWAALSGAIWSITDGAWSDNLADYNAGIESSLYKNSGAQADVLAARSAVLGGWTPNETFVVYTPDPQGAGQEFWSEVPEPSATVLLAWGTLALALAPLVSKLRRKKLLA